MNNLFKFKLDQIVDLMICGKLREDIDDSLLEKFLGILRNRFIRAPDNRDPTDLLHTTKLPSLFYMVLKSLLGSQTEEPDVHVVTFAVHTLGLFLAEEQVFCFFQSKNDFLPLFSQVCHERSFHSPSVHAAFLACLSSFTRYTCGLQWLATNRVLDTMYSSFSATSFYVRKNAVSFFKTAFVQWSTQTVFSLQPSDSISFVFYQAIERIVASLKEVDPSGRGAETKNCCVTVLTGSAKESDVLKALLGNEFKLCDKICEIWRSPQNEVEPSEGMLELVAEICAYSKDSNCSVDVSTDMIQLLLENRYLSSVIILTGKLLERQQNSERLISAEQVAVMLSPVFTVTNMPIPWKVPADYNELLQDEMKDKSVCLRLVRLSLASLSKLVLHMDVHVLSLIVKAACRLLLIPDTSNNLLLYHFVAANQRILLSVLQLLSSVLQTPSYSELPADEKICTVDCLLLQIENTSCEHHILSQVIDLIGKVVAYEPADQDVWSKSLVVRFAQIFQKKLLDSKWPIVDSSLQVVSRISELCQGVTQPWVDFFSCCDILSIVWDLAFFSDAEGYVRASAIHVLASVCFTSVLFEHLISLRQASEESAISMLCQLAAKSSDVFVQRECISCFLRWSENENRQFDERIYNTLVKIIKVSLDTQAKLLALQTWQCVSEKLASVDACEYVKCLCRIGYGFSVLFTLKDHDRTVQKASIQMIIMLRKTLLNMGVKRSSLSFKELSEPVVSQQTTAGDGCCASFSAEEKEAGINDVLNMGTLNSICSILCPDPIVAPYTEVTPSSLSAAAEGSCCCQTFWDTLWSDEIIPMLYVCTKSSDVYMENYVALLDDILAAEDKYGDVRTTMYQEADCY